MSEGKARGGVARAKSLSAPERRSIAEKAAAARWDTSISQAVCGAPETPLVIAGVEIPCYVLEDGTRVLTQAGFLEGLGRHRKANVRPENHVSRRGRVPPLLQGQAIRGFISPEVLERSRPLVFRTPQGVRASGYRADLLPDVCEIYLRARDAGKLPQNQQHVAKQADLLMRGLARVGIIALVDEVTGYQELRVKDALARILEDFIDKELRPWISTFPAEFYRQLFRLRGLDFQKDSVRRPQYFGILTNDLIYARLAPGVLEELKRVTARNTQGKLKHKYFQRLTANLGYPMLREHLGSVVTIMKLSTSWWDFIETMNRIHPRYGTTMVLPLEFEDDDGRGL